MSKYRHFGKTAAEQSFLSMLDDDVSLNIFMSINCLRFHRLMRDVEEACKKEGKYFKERAYENDC